VFGERTTFFCRSNHQREGQKARGPEGQKARRSEGQKARRSEGQKARRKARRPEGQKARRPESQNQRAREPESQKEGQKERTPTPQIWRSIWQNMSGSGNNRDVGKRLGPYNKRTYPKQGGKLKQVLPYNITLATSLWAVSQGLGKVSWRLPAR
jgi:hypothetical protein